MVRLTSRKPLLVPVLAGACSLILQRFLASSILFTRALLPRRHATAVGLGPRARNKCSRSNSNDVPSLEAADDTLVFWALNSGAGLKILESHLATHNYIGGAPSATVNDLFVLEQIPDYDLQRYHFANVHAWKQRVLAEMAKVDKSASVSVSVKRYSPEHETYLLTRKGQKPVATNQVPAGVAEVADGTAQSMPSTALQYHEDTYCFDLKHCKVLQVLDSLDARAEDSKVHLDIILDQTIFHPQGGGQPGDKGTLVPDLQAVNLPSLSVSSVSMQGSKVVHGCLVDLACAEAWKEAAEGGILTVRCAVDESWRLQNARLHSAGHLIDAAVEVAGLKWIAGKGYHFPDGPSVEYKLGKESKQIDMSNAEEKEATLAAIQDGVDGLIANGATVHVLSRDGVRHVEMAGTECPCGGTHVKEISEIGKVTINKIKKKKGNVKISYSVMPP